MISLRMKASLLIEAGGCLVSSECDSHQCKTLGRLVLPVIVFHLLLSGCMKGLCGSKQFPGPDIKECVDEYRQYAT